MSLARRHRRELAKQFGFLGKQEGVAEMRERLQRSQKMGKQMHIQHLERVQNDLIESRRQREIQKQDELAQGLSTESTEQQQNVSLTNNAFEFLKNTTPDSEPSASAE
jgi:hypothetical protein